MKKWLVAGLLFSFLLPALVQVVSGQEGARGPLPFNPQTLETVSGIVVEAPEIKQGGIPEMEHLIVKAKEEKLTVVLGPSWFLTQQDWKVTTLDRLEITGSRVILDGKPTLIALEVKQGEKVVRFRDQSGRPLWARPRPQAQ